MTLHELFKKRQAHYMKQLVKYGQLVFNDHFILILVLFVGALGYTYSTWLQTIDDSATHLVFIALTVGFMSIFLGSTATYLEPADALFLLPKEREYIAIYKRQTIKSYVIHLIPSVITLIVITPILKEVAHFGLYEIGAICFMWFSLKAIDVTYLFYIDMSGNHRLNHYKWLLRGMMYMMTLLSANFAIIMAFISLLLGGGVVYYGFVQLPATIHISLEILISREQARLQRIYYFFNLFTDVPYIQQKPRRLRWLDPMIEWLQPKHVSHFGYYLRREFVRQGTYNGLVIRLLMIGLLTITLIEQPFMIYIISLLSHYLILVQLLPLRERLLKHAQFVYYPPEEGQVRQDMQHFLRQLSLVVTGLFGCAGLLHSFAIGSTILGLNFVLFVGFIYLYLPYYLRP